MDRRTLLRLLAATALAGCGSRNEDERGLSIVVAGAGIVGASCAYHLAKAGASVTVIDREGPATQASRGTFAWINATYAKQPRNYHALTQKSVANWRDLQDTLNLPIRWGGSLEWFEDAERQQRLVAQIAEQAEWGEAARMVDAEELATLEPQVDFGGARQVAFSGNDGAVDSVAATRALLAAAETFGATVKYPCELTGVALRGAGARLTAVETSLGTLRANRLVLATGAAPGAAWTFAATDIPQRTTPGVIVVTAPMRRILNRIVVAPGVHMHQRDDGRVVLGEQAGAPKTHALRLAGRPNQFPSPLLAQQHAARLLAVAERFAPDIAAAAIEDVCIGWRPLPVDGHPVLGASPGRPDVYLAVMHSGVSLAPIAGQLAAYELISGEPAEGLDDFRPGRGFEDKGR